MSNMVPEQIVESLNDLNVPLFDHIRNPPWCKPLKLLLQHLPHKQVADDPISGVSPTISAMHAIES